MAALACSRCSSGVLFWLFYLGRHNSLSGPTNRRGALAHLRREVCLNILRFSHEPAKEGNTSASLDAESIGANSFAETFTQYTMESGREIP